MLEERLWDDNPRVVGKTIEAILSLLELDNSYVQNKRSKIIISLAHSGMNSQQCKLLKLIDEIMAR
jgi:hypothetical protein